MARLIVGAPAYKDVFGDTLEVPQFVSELPEYYSIVQSWADPSVRFDLGLDRVEAISSKLARDVAASAKRVTWVMSVSGEANLPTALLSGVRELVYSSPIAAELPLSQIAVIFDPKNRPPGVKGAPGMVIGAALGAVGIAIPIVGQIGAVVAAFAAAIFGAVAANKKKQDLQDARVREELYKTFPPLQVQDSATDTQIVRRIHAIAETGDWTPIFLPRFEGEWVGLERDRGFAFAPGETTVGSDFIGKEQQVFVPSGGIGCIPNTGNITSVIQVHLDPRGPEMQAFLKGGTDPRLTVGAYKRVIDTGAFYKSAEKTAALHWSWAQQGPYLFRLNSHRMGAAWQKYFEGALDYIRSRGFTWGATVPREDGTNNVDPNANLEGFYASAIYQVIGAFGGEWTGGTTEHPVFTVYNKPSGSFGEQLHRNGKAGPLKLWPLHHLSGGFLPFLNPPGEGFIKAMGSWWDRGPHIKAVCAKVREQQVFDLQNSLVCYYVRESDAAFKQDADLLALLREARRGWVKTTRRTEIVLADVPEGERVDGKDMRTMLIGAGVPQRPQLGKVLEVSAKRPTQDPFVPPSLPWAPLNRRHVAAALMGVGGLLLGGALWERRRRGLGRFFGE